MKYPWKRFLACALSCGLLLGCCSGCSDKGSEEKTIQYSTLGESSNQEGSSEIPLPTGGGSTGSGDIIVAPARPSITLSIWAPSEDIGEDQWLTRQLESFAAANSNKYDITWDISVCSEADASSMVRKDPADAADVYFFASDQLEQLIAAGALSKLGGSYKDQVLNDNYPIMTQSVTYTDGEIYGFPVSTNTWFMYYNKSTFNENDIQSLETMLSKGRVAMDMTNGWYNGAFFFGAGGTLFGPNGTDASAGIDFNGAIGVAVAERMVELFNHPNFLEGGNGADLALMLEERVDAIFSGYWYYDALKAALGDDLGLAVLPTFQANGQTYQMKSFAGSKAIGVNDQISDSVTKQAATELAAYLASIDSQQLRFALRSVTPTHKALANSYVMYHPVAAVELQVIQTCSIFQPCISAMGKYWSPMGIFGAGISNGTITKDNAADKLASTLDQMNG